MAEEGLAGYYYASETKTQTPSYNKLAALLCGAVDADLAF
jgi:hypothetical protein